MAEEGHRGRWAMLVTRNFPPLLGGMERLNTHLLGSLADTGRVGLCGPAGSAPFAQRAAEIEEAPIAPLYGFLLRTMRHAWRMAGRRRPAWIMAGSGLTAPIAWLAARRVGAKVAVYLHGLDVIAPSVIYRWLWLPFIRRCDVVVVNSHATLQLALGRGVPREKIQVVNPGTDVPPMDAARAAAFRSRHGLGSAPLLLSVGRLTRRKGLAEFVAETLPSIVAAHPNVCLLVIGDEAKDALHGGSGGERERIVRTSREAGVEQNVRFLGRCSEEDLHAAYQASNVHVFPVLNLPGDVEGFGMVALEAAAHGLPTVAFDAGGVSDAVKAGVTGTLVKQGAYDLLGAEILRYLSKSQPQPDMAEACRAFAQTKAWPVFAKKIRAALEGHDTDVRA